jgi:hypothetical protein
MYSTKLPVEVIFKIASYLQIDKICRLRFISKGFAKALFLTISEHIAQNGICVTHTYGSLFKLQRLSGLKQITAYINQLTIHYRLYPVFQDQSKWEKWVGKEYLYSPGKERAFHEYVQFIREELNKWEWEVETIAAALKELPNLDTVVISPLALPGKYSQSLVEKIWCLSDRADHVTASLIILLRAFKKSCGYSVRNLQIQGKINLDFFARQTLLVPEMFVSIKKLSIHEINERDKDMMLWFFKLFTNLVCLRASYSIDFEIFQSGDCHLLEELRLLHKPVTETTLFNVITHHERLKILAFSSNCLTGNQQFLLSRIEQQGGRVEYSADTTIYYIK